MCRCCDNCVVIIIIITVNIIILYIITVPGCGSGLISEQWLRSKVIIIISVCLLFGISNCVVIVVIVSNYCVVIIIITVIIIIILYIMYNRSAWLWE